MKKPEQPNEVEESINAIPGIANHADLQQGLANTMAAVLNGEISAKDGLAIAKAATRQRTKINRGVLKDNE